jgi:molybdopterin-guanine dinucleotide biosynthesis protein A
LTATGEPGGPGKAAARLAGRPLVSYPLAALAPVCERVVVVCKRDTELPPLGDAERWEEPDEPRHPLTGIVCALERAGAPVLVCAADMPFVTARGCRELIESAMAERNRRAVVAVADGGLEPLLAIYRPSALPVLTSFAPDTPLRRTVEALEPALVPLATELVRSINTAPELAAAEERLWPAGGRVARPGKRIEVESPG